MHGHLRASIIGDREGLFLMGDEVLGDAHFGDWGSEGLRIVAASDETRGWAGSPNRDEGETRA